MSGFDLVFEQSVVRDMHSQQAVYKYFDNFSKRFEKGEFSQYIYDEIRAVVFERLRSLESLKNQLV